MSETNTKQNNPKVIPLVIRLTDETGRWFKNPLRNACKRKTQGTTVSG